MHIDIYTPTHTNIDTVSQSVGQSVSGFDYVVSVSMAIGQKMDENKTDHYTCI